MVHDQPVEEISDPRVVREVNFEALIRAWKVGGRYYSELIPSYPYEELGASIDQEIAAMVQARFDASTPYDSAHERMNAAESRFREGVQRVTGISTH